MPKKKHQIEELRARSKSIKLRFLKMYHRAHAGHIGSSLSVAEMLTFVKFGWMEHQDHFILSKGHAAAALYSTLAEAGDLDESDIHSFYKDGTQLTAHPSPDVLPKIPFATGSLGHGLSLSAGLALGAKLAGSEEKNFCLSSDGELNEGSVWEAALFAAHHQLNHLVWLIDRNELQGFGRTEDVLALKPLVQKLKAFGWQVTEAKGHDFASLLNAKKRVLIKSKKPKVIICHTVKGHGVGYMEDTIDCHYLPMDDNQYQLAVSEIENDNARES